MMVFSLDMYERRLGISLTWWKTLPPNSHLLGRMVAGLGGEGRSSGFVVCEHIELPTFHKVLEVPIGKVSVLVVAEGRGSLRHSEQGVRRRGQQLI